MLGTHTHTSLLALVWCHCSSVVEKWKLLIGSRPGLQVVGECRTPGSDREQHAHKLSVGNCCGWTVLGKRAIVKNEEETCCTPSLQPIRRLQESQREGPTSTSKAKSLQLDPSSSVPCFPSEKGGRSLGGRGIPGPGSSRLGLLHSLQGTHTSGIHQARWLHLEPLACTHPYKR